MGDLVEGEPSHPGTLSLSLLLALFLGEALPEGVLLHATLIAISVAVWRYLRR